MDIKKEYQHLITICHGCLSADRKVVILTKQNKALFFKIREDSQQSQEDTKHLQLCWECNTLLNKMKSFQTRIKNAQKILLPFLQYPKEISFNTLSYLQNHQKYYYDFEFIHGEEPKHLILEQNDLILEQGDVAQHRKEDEETLKEEDLENLDLDIKVEDNENIKEEYDSMFNDNDTDYYDPEFKIETDLELKIVDKNNSKSRRTKRQEVKKDSIKNYEHFATITKTNDVKIKVADTVFLTEKEVEEVLKRDRKSTGFGRLPQKCKECQLGYKRRLDLLRHRAFHHSKSEFPTRCAACQRRINDYTQLEEHWRDYHNNMLQCNLCAHLCRSKGEMRKHYNRTHTKTYTCNCCQQQFRTLREFCDHYKLTHERVVCDYCNLSYASKRRLESHIKRTHLPAYCSVCDRTYKTYHVFENHVRTHHPELMSCDTRKEMCYCVECDKQYPSIYKYRRHLQQSARHRPRKKVRVPCPSCDKIFTRKTYMNNHYRQVHMKNSKNYCELCNKHFATGYGIRKHIQFVHQKMPQPKNKICDLCGRGFSTNRILTNHRRTHTGERPFKCRYCPATFAQDTAMKTHQKTQHKNIMDMQLPS